MTQALAPPSSSRSAQRTVVAVIGTTGVGKSDLAVALARSLLPSGRGEVLSADSMQLYKGLDVITNKMTTEEMRGVRHWGLDLVTPGQGSWEVGRWCSEADKQMSEMDGRTLPIVCGGTHYFIQHFLFPPESLSFERGSTTSAPRRWEPPHPQPRIPGDMDPELRRLLDTFWTERPVWPGEAEEAGPSTHASNLSAEAKDQRLLSLHRLLAAVDPGEAGRWHWRDGRKVRRGLERWWEKNGEGPQDTQDGESGEAGSKGRRARFRTLIFWVYEPLETLRPRLSRRVDKMVENGLLREIAELRGIAERLYGSTNATDHSEGIFQSIGYKEFADLNLEQEDPSADPAFGPMLERMKLSTHQYAKSQIKWIRKQLLPAVKEARSLGGNVEVYVVHGGEAGHEPAIKLLNSFLSSEQMPSWAEVGHPDAGELLAELGDPEGSRVPDTAERQQINQRRDCEICSTPGNPLSISVKDWDVHVKSRSHRGKVTILNAGGIDGWIEQQRSKGVAKKLERQALKAGSALDPPDSHTIPDT